jgi:hypothetical protein
MWHGDSVVRTVLDDVTALVATRRGVLSLRTRVCTHVGGKTDARSMNILSERNSAQH